MSSPSQDLLRRLGESNEDCLRGLMVPVPKPDVDPSSQAPRLDSRTRGLVRLAALVALGAPTTSLCWAVELACGAGVDDADIVAALVTAASAETTAWLEAGATPLALALGYETAAPGGVSSPAARLEGRG